MTDRPILFSAPMVQALLDGRKTQTRRAVEPTCKDFAPGQLLIMTGPRFGGTAYRFDLKFEVGDRLYVREEYYQRGHWEPTLIGLTKGGKQKWYFAPADDAIRFEAPDEYRKARSSDDPGTIAWHKRLGRFMPRRYSRLTLIVTDVRVERLQDCSEADAIAEGIIYQNVIVGCHGSTGRHVEITAYRYFDPNDSDDDDGHEYAADAYASLWNSINGPGAWEANPWVVAVSFEVQRGNIDTLPTPGERCPL